MASSTLAGTARVALMAGAAGSIALMLRAGSRQRSALLIFLFTAWVLSPFLALAVANLRRRQWPRFTQTAIYVVMLGVSALSLAVYALAATVWTAKPGFIYLVVPAACWLLIVLVSAAAFVSSRRTR